MPTEPAPDKVADVVVNGRRIYFEYKLPTWVPTDTPEVTDASINPLHEEPPAVVCQPTTGMTDQQKLQVLLRFAAAVLREKLLAQTPPDKERASALYIDRNGAIKSTPPVLRSDQQAQTDWTGVPKLPNGEYDYSTIIALVHTHPQYIRIENNPPIDYYSPSDPFRLNRPSPWQSAQVPGDWALFNAVTSEANLQASNYGTSGARPDLSMIIIGFDGTKMAMNQYFSSDNGYTSTLSGGGGLGNDNQPGARGQMSITPLPPC